MLLMVLDLSKPEQALDTFNKWLIKLAIFNRAYHQRLSSDASYCMKQSAMHYLKHARQCKGDIIKAQSSTATIHHDFADKQDLISENFSIPMVVVGTKSDSINVSDGAAMKKARDLQCQLRTICLEIGAALVYTSTVNETNCTQLKKYVMHRLYP